MSISKGECLALLKEAPPSEWQRIRALANATKEETYGKEVFVRGIIEFSNYCRKNCLYCGIRRDAKIARYRMSPKEIVETAEKIYQSGIRTIVLQSGEDLQYDRKTIVEIITAIKKRCNVAVTLCIGERSFEDYKAFFEAGAERFLIKHETSNPKLYEFYHPGESLKDRLKLYEMLKAIGYKTGLGNIVGLPKTTLRDYINDIFLIKELDADMAGIGPFVPSKDTPLSDAPSPSCELVINLIALTRLICNDINLPATTALFTIGGRPALMSALKAGANVVMPNFTPIERRKLYRLYDNKSPLSIENTKEMAEELGLFITETKGERRYAKCA